MSPKSNNAKTVLKITLSIFIAIILLLISYLLYIVLSYERVEDNLTLDVSYNASDYVSTGEKLKLITYNIGFGAYSPDYSFFMDGGEHSRALSEEAVITNTRGAIDVIINEAPDFIALQEVDVDGTRSYHVNQTEIFKNAFDGYDSVYAQNYDSAYFLYPFNEPIGANESGMMTFSAYKIHSSLRISLPIEDNFYKFLDLDRAYTVTQIPVKDSSSLMLYNVHLSAYTSDGTIADEQLKLLSTDMEEEYNKGNYVIATGDFNKDVLGDSSQYFERAEGEYTWAKPINLSLLPDGFTCYGGENSPSCRNAEFPLKNDGTDFVLTVDGAIVSPNVEVISCETIDLNFAYSDHDPVRLEFILK